MQTQERGEIRQRPERHVGQLPLPQRAVKAHQLPENCTRRITRGACATEDIRRATKRRARSRATLVVRCTPAFP